MKHTKRIVSVLLAVLMVLTATPLSALAAMTHKESDSVVDTLDTALRAYEAKMDGTIYKNMKQAYTAYVNAQAARDAYVYGDANIDLGTYATALNTACNATNMPVFSHPVANATTESRDVTTNLVGAPYSVNLFYSPKQSVVYDEGDGNKKNVRTQMLIGDGTIMMYDGDTTPTMPVFCFWYYDQTGFSSRAYFALYPTDNATTGNQPANSSNFRLHEAWHCGLDKGTGDWLDCWNNDSKRAGCYGANVSLTAESTSGNRAKWNRMANYMTYEGGDSGFTNGYKTVSPGWFGYTGYSSTSNIVRHYLTNAGTIYVIDYKSHKGELESHTTYLSQVSSYKQGGLSTYFEKYDAATNAASNLVGVTPDTLATRAGALVTTASALHDATVTADNADFTTLKNTLDTKRSAYNDPDGSTSYTTESWTAFETAYDNAKLFMASLTTNGYVNTDPRTNKTVYTLNQDLIAAKLDAGARADTTTVEYCIDDIGVVQRNPRYFIQSTVSPTLFSDAEAAKVAIWGSVDNYRIPGKAPFTSQQDMVDGWEDTLGDQLAVIQFDTTATVTAAKGYSLVTAIPYAQEYLAHYNDYSNYRDLERAVEAAQAFNPTLIPDTSDEVVDQLQGGVVIAKIDEYIALVSNIINAITNLQPSFSKISNATVIDRGIEITIDCDGSAVSSGHLDGYSVSMTYPTNMVYFRTTHDACAFQVRDAKFKMNNSSGRDGALDYVNVSGGIGTSEEVSFNKNFGTLNDEQKGAYPASLVQGQYVFGHVDGLPDSGIFFASEEGIDKTADLATENGTNPISGSVNCPKSVVGISTLSIQLPATATKTLDTTTMPRSQDYTISSSFGAMIYGEYKDVLNTYKGYISLGSQAYTIKTTIIDVAYLFDLFDEIAKLNPNDYTSTSWSDIDIALEQAKETLNYANMTAAEIETEVQRRYLALVNAYNRRDLKANFDDLDAAISNLTVNDYEYDVATLNSINTTLAGLTYANYTASQRAATGSYDHQANINKETTRVNNLVNNLVKSNVDFSALDASVMSLADDPDAFSGYEAARAVLNTAKENKYAPVRVGTKTVLGVNMTQTDVNNAVTEARSSLYPATYNVYVNYKEGDTPVIANAAYGEMVTVNFDEKSDVSYHYVSNTTSTTDKYYTTDNVIHFVVKGDTYITTKTAADLAEDNKCKINVKNALSGKLIAVNYADKNASYTLPDAPALAFYNFDGYSVPGYADLLQAGDTVTFTGNATISAEYSAKSSAFDMVLMFKDYNNSYTSLDFEANYNELVKMTQSGLTNTKNNGKGTIEVNGETIEGNKNVRRATKTEPIYAYVQLPYSYYDDEAFNDYFAEDFVKEYVYDGATDEDVPVYYDKGELGYDGVATFLGFRSDYSFYASSSSMIIALSEDTFTGMKEAGIVDIDETTGAAIRSADELVYNEGKISFISTYALPEDAELVECGLLLAKGTYNGVFNESTFNKVDNSTLYRLKSTQHTIGNQFVISLITKSMPNNQQFNYVAYVKYKKGNNIYTKLSQAKTQTYDSSKQ